MNIVALAEQYGVDERFPKQYTLEASFKGESGHECRLKFKKTNKGIHYAFIKDYIMFPNETFFGLFSDYHPLKEHAAPCLYTALRNAVGPSLAGKVAMKLSIDPECDPGEKVKGGVNWIDDPAIKRLLDLIRCLEYAVEKNDGLKRPRRVL